MPLTPLPGSIYPKTNPTNGKQYTNWAEQLNDHLYNESILVVDNIEQLKKLNPSDLSIQNNTQFKNVYVKGYYTPNDGGGGLFSYNKDSLEKEDKGLVFLPSSITDIQEVLEKIEVVTDVNIDPIQATVTDKTIDGTTITYTNSTTPGRFERIWDKSTINVKWFGAKGDGASDDWEGVQKGVESVKVGGMVYIPFGNYKTTQPLIINKPICLNGREALIESHHAGTCIDVVRRDGNGSIGDADWVSKQREYSLNMDLPTLVRINNPATNKKDGSTGIRINNVYFGRFFFNIVSGFENGIIMDAEKTGSGARGTSHCVLFLGRLANIKNIILNGRENGEGWVTENMFIKGSFGSPDGVNVPTGNVPDDHIHVLSIGKDMGWQNNNTFEKCSFEGSAKYGLYAQGPQSNNALYHCRYEMPNSIKIIYLDKNNRDWTIKNGHGLTIQNIEDNGLYNTIEYNDYDGEIKYYDGVILARTNTNYLRPKIVEWYPLGPTRSNPVKFDGNTSQNPLILDLSQSRKFTISILNNSPVPANSIKLINSPTKYDYEFELQFIQSTNGGNDIDSQFLISDESSIIQYSIYPSKIEKRSVGKDVYTIRKMQSNLLNNFMVTGYFADK